MKKSYGEKITGLFVVKTSSIILLLLLLIFDQDASMIYLFMLTTYFIWYTSDKNIELPIERSDQGRAKSFMIAAIIYAFFLVSSSFLSSIPSINGGNQTPQAIVTLFGAQLPVLANNTILTIIVWGVLIPLIESALFFGIILEGIINGLANYFGTKILVTFRITSTTLWGVVFFVASLFTFYHFQARGLTDSLGLLLTFYFAVISCWVSLYFRQVREAIFFHFDSNVIAVLSRLGYLHL